jgi:hypothetical protein
VSFGAALQIHEFDLQSPTKFRLQNKVDYEATELNDDELRLELFVAQQDGKIASAATPTKRAPMAKKVDQVWCRDLRSELVELGFSSAPNAQRLELANRKRLATTIVRRAELLFSGVPVGLKLMSQRQLVQELETRRIKRQGPRQQMLRDLAAAMIKDTADGLIGDGYEFGRRFIRIEDVIDPMNDKEMRDCLKQRFQLPSAPRKKEDKRELLTNMMEEWLKNQSDECVVNQLQEELHSRGLRDRAASTDKEQLFEHLFAEVETEAEDNPLAYDLRVEIEEEKEEDGEGANQAKGSVSKKRKLDDADSPRKKRKLDGNSDASQREAPVGILKSTQQQDAGYCTIC